MQSVKGVLSGQTVRPSPPMPDFIPVGQAAKALGVSPMTVRRLYDARKLPGYRHGRSRQILRTFVDGFVAEIKAGHQPVLQEYAAQWFAKAQEGAA
ncbi:MAG TPA: excisionase family DNA-binding protein [Rugosimonospora sp.]|nr:excisionase family DNA-binding protein [Rugosimonospora sp.]